MFSLLTIMFVVLMDFPLLVVVFQDFPFYGSKVKLFLSLPSSNKTNYSKTWDISCSWRIQCIVRSSVITTELNICISFQKQIYFCDNYHSLYIAFLRRKRFYCSSVHHICSNTLTKVFFKRTFSLHGSILLLTPYFLRRVCFKRKTDLNY